VWLNPFNSVPGKSFRKARYYRLRVVPTLAKLLSPKLQTIPIHSPNHQQQMRELKANSPKPILETHYPIQQRGSKRWVAAQRQAPFRQKLMHNNNVEAAYHRIIAIVKKTIAGQLITYYEKDMKRDRSEGLYGMHSFITPNFYWRLECDLCCDYQIIYGFHNCPYEEEIMKLMRAYPLDRVSTPKLFQSDFNTFYENVLKLQDKQFIFTS